MPMLVTVLDDPAVLLLAGRGGRLGPGCEMLLSFALSAASNHLQEQTAMEVE